MRHRPIRGAAALLLLVASLPAAAAPPPRVDEAHGDTSYIRILFDQPMVTWQGMSRLALAPDAPCDWYWEDDTALACTLDRGGFSGGFAPATVYRVRLEGLHSQAGEALPATTLEVPVEPPSLDLERPEWVAGWPVLVVASDQPLSAAAIRAVLDLRFDGVPLDYTLEPHPRERWDERNAPDGVAWRIVPATRPGAGRLTGTVRDGLASPLGPARGEADNLFDYAVGEPFALAEWRCAKVAGACAPEQPIIVRFTRPLSAAAIATIRAALPEGATLADDPTDCDYGCWRKDASPLSALKIATAAPRRDFVLDLPADLAAEDGSTLGMPTHLVIPVAAYSPGYRIDREVRLALPGAVPADPVEGRNLARGDRWTMQSIGADLRRVVRRIVPPRAPDVFAPVRTPPLDRAVVADGGLVFEGPASQRGLGRATAVAPFQLLVGAGRSGYTAWASEWRDAAGVASAELELLDIGWDGTERLVGEGRTGADGIARLARPADAVPGDGLRVLRATARDRVVVVPIASGTTRTLAPETGGDATPWASWRRGEATLRFGALSRTLARPGETVDYRLWLRKRIGPRLALVEGDAAVELQLVAGSTDAVHQTWSATLDEWGSAHGRLALPAILPDDVYCIRQPGDARWSSDGPCFLVMRFADQALYAELAASAPVLRGGDDLVLDVVGGYYSGGPAANARLRVDGLVMPYAFTDAYPAFAGYAFLDGTRHATGEEESDPLVGARVPERVDARGTARVSLQLPSRFIEEEVDDELSEAERDAAPTIAFGRMQFNAALRTEGDADAASPTANVFFAEHPRYVGLRTARWWLPTGEDPVLDAVVATLDGTARPGAPVRVRVETADADGDVEVLARCELVAGTPAPCAFRAPEPGAYAIVAEADDAAPVRIVRWFGDAAPVADDDATASLVLVRASDGVSPARVRLVQPHARAMALFVAEYDDALSAWTRAVGPDGEIDVPVQAGWAPGFTLRVLVRPVGEDAAAALRVPTLDAALRVAVPRAARLPIAVTLDDRTLAPGAPATLRLRNDGPARRLATIAIVDDSVYQQATDLNTLLDPADETFLGRLAQWSTQAWHDLAAWKDVGNPFFDDGAGARADGAPAPPTYDDESTELDTIEVTGSRLKRADIFDERPAVDRFAGTPPARAGIALARVRHRFTDAAYWNAGIALAPGETREIAVPLPDNLTRWRVLVWTSDAGDDFALVQDTLTTALPVELRLALPDQLVEGDRGRGAVSTRAADGIATTVRVEATAEGAGARASVDDRGAVAPHATLVRGIALAPDAPGDIAVVARAESGAGADAVSGVVPVRSRWATQTLPQAGWLDGTLRLPLPAIPAGARDAELALEVGRSGAAWRAGWLGSLRDYPHRCWEQILSRGLGAALALADAQGRAAWPDAQQAIDEAFSVAPGFRHEEGGHYDFFVPAAYYTGGTPPPVADAWTLRAFGLLERLGHPVPKALVADWRIDTHLRWKGAPTARQAEVAAQIAAARAASGAPVDAAVLHSVRGAWPEMSWHARSELVRAMHADAALAAEAAEGLAALREAGVDRGLRRVLADDARVAAWAMGSSLRDHCAVTATLWDLDTDPATLPRRRAFLRGVQDLYAGGTPSLDTQASVHCLLALRAAAARDGGDAADIVATFGAATRTLRVDAATPTASWRSPVAPDADALILATPAGASATLSVVAELRYAQDQREAVPSAVGLQLARRFDVLRDGAWVATAGTGLREGDWVRVALRVTAPAWRHFVAVTDAVPGGWTTRDLRLDGVGGAAMRAAGDPGSAWFDVRQTGAGEVRLYAEDVPPGTHEVYYFAQATHAGTYFAAPAIAEQMYGRANRATTVPATVTIAE